MRTEAPWNHQREGLAFALAREASYLAIDMGLGKSRIGVEFADAIESTMTLVFSTKRGCKYVWPGQFEDWSKREVAVHVMEHPSVPRRISLARLAITSARLRNHPVAICANWEMLIRKPFVEFVKAHEWDVALFDEMHKMKGHRGKRSRALALLRDRFPRRIALSGTPMPHDPLDMWAQYRSLDPKILGTRYWDYAGRYTIMGGFPNPHTGRPTQIVGWRDLEHHKALLARIMYEPDPDTIEVELPSERHVRVEVELSPAGLRAYKAVESDIVLQIGRGEINPQNGLVKLLRLQQLASGVAVSIDVDEYGDETKYTDIVDHSKEEAIAEIIQGTTEHVVVFCVFHAELDAIHRAAESVDAQSAEVSGRGGRSWPGGHGLPEWDTPDGPRVLAVQIAAGSECLDMTRARHCAFMSTGFNMGNYKQALKRVHRAGWEKYAEPDTDRPVTYYHLIAKNTVDDRVYGTLLKRGDLVRSALEGLRALSTIAN